MPRALGSRAASAARPRVRLRPARCREPPHRAGRPRQPARRRGLDEAVRLADQGRFAEAAACCEEHLRRHGPSAEAFYLLGLVRDAGGNPTDAANYYRKALYLDPNHHEALVHLAFLLEQQGNSAARRC